MFPAAERREPGTVAKQVAGSSRPGVRASRGVSVAGGGLASAAEVSPGAASRANGGASASATTASATPG